MRFPWVAAAGVICLTAGAGGAAGQETFGRDPVWHSGPAEFTKCIALGDVDRDGDLDLVCGHLEEPLFLYRNDGAFTATPVWTSAKRSNFTSVALGDVDGDGDLDLVAADLLGPKTLYRNDDGEFTRGPVWETLDRSRSERIALGDVDGDGDLDLACANPDSAETLYLNDGGVFSREPDWFSAAPGGRTSGVAWGDVDGDGDLDLVFTGEEISLHRNRDGIPEREPSWSVPAAPFTALDAALGDVDGDGDLDLVCGNSGNKTALYRNDGGTFLDAPVWRSTLQGGKNTAVDLGDVDLDGDLDLLVGIDAIHGDALFRNDDGVFTSTPVWVSGPTHATAAAALADVDGDGDLDVVCGNLGQSDTVYRNEPVPLTVQEVWTTDVLYETVATLLGDIDGDGDPDLVTGGFNQRDHLFRNDGGALTRTPVWSTAAPTATQAAALGDVDGDGDLDLVCGSYDQSDVLYRNDAGTLTDTPVWSSLDRHRTSAVALGDLDRDGDPDLVAATSDRGIFVYDNDRGTFPDVPGWALGSTPDITVSIALADVDLDGDLDLVCGNRGSGNTLYLNEGGRFGSKPVWISQASNLAEDIAVGDVDGDGDPDLACGNTNQSNTLYRNQGGTFTPTPVWFSGFAYDTKAVALHDVDGDGDLDLLCGNYRESEPNQLYRNDGGTFTSSPTWSSIEGWRATAVGVGDVDRDGDPDVVFGNQSLNIQLFDGLRRPAFRGDPASPVHHRPNNPAFLRDIRMFRPTPGSVRIGFTLVDAESDPVWVAAHYQFSGDPRWNPVRFTGGEGAAGPFASSPGGTAQFPGGEAYTLVWDDPLLPIDRRDVVLRVEAVEMPARVGLAPRAAAHDLDVGPVIAPRPQLVLSPESLDFGAITVGDTLEATVFVSNPGTEPLLVSDPRTPAEFRARGKFPMSVAAGAVDSFLVAYTPVFDTAGTGEMTLVTNDPGRPLATVKLTRDLKPLAVSRRELKPPDGVRLNEALGLIFTPRDGCRVESGLLHVISPEFDAFTTPFIPSDDDFTAFIPSYLVTEGDLAYYLELFNSPARARDPAPGAADSLYRIPTPSPFAFTTVPRAQTSSGFLAGEDIAFWIVAQAGSIVDTGTVYYRAAGTREFSRTPVDPDPIVILPDGQISPDGLALLPGHEVTERGLEYYVELVTRTTVLHDPPQGQGTHLIRTIVTDVHEDSLHAGGGYRMISVPYDYGTGFTGTLETLLGGNAAFGAYDPVRWRCFRWLSGGARYAELGGDAPEAFTVKPGRAFWIIARADNRFSSRIPALSLPSFAAPANRRSETVELEPGWNQIGNPFDFPVAWALSVSSPAPPTLDGPWAWDGGTGRYEKATVLDPFSGYFVWNDSTDTVLVEIQAVDTTGTPPPPDRIKPAETGGWTLSLTAASGDRASPAATAGTAPDARDGRDARDALAPPPGPGGALEITFLDADEVAAARGAEAPPRRYARDLRPGPREGHAWRFDVLKSFAEQGPADRVTVTADGLDAVPGILSVVLVDHELGKRVDLRAGPEYAFHLGRRDRADAAEARFELLVGEAGFVDARGPDALPARTRLLQNRPNPVRTGTVIRYELAEAGDAALRIFDVRGRLVASFPNPGAAPGRYDVPWTRADDGGRRVAPGVYFYRLESPAGAETRKLLVID